MPVSDKIACVYYRTNNTQLTGCLLKKAIAAKERSIREKEKLVEIIDMLIVNTINLAEEVAFSETKTFDTFYRGSCNECPQNVSKLVVFFEEALAKKLPKK
ncbi:hypothetical protein NEDG_00974 [Nematocida displodere]|uniref:Uncharacterized protein n=1 Tax=Nematocida displodere TaxID=1805483 RepID=A0A177EA91_9MICR|nr:hypothetical protein NEDG_00974 [Nematocida displodere]